MEHFLETYNVELSNLIKDVIEPLVLKVIFVSLDRRRPEEDIISEQLNIFDGIRHKGNFYVYN